MVYVVIGGSAGLTAAAGRLPSNDDSRDSDGRSEGMLISIDSSAAVVAGEAGGVGSLPAGEEEMRH